MSVSVSELIRSRIGTVSQRGERKDPFHLALVIEGGGMRGVVSGGMVTAIEHRGLLHCFDSIHGSSAGACAGAYLTAGQAELGTSIYYEDINNEKFISLWRGLRGGPIMNADFLIDEVMKKVKVIDVQRLLDTPDFLYIVKTAVADGRARISSSWKNPSEFFEALRASIKIPVISGGSVSIDGKEYVDGGVVQQIAVDSAMAVGATHILVLVTRMGGELERTSTATSRFIERSVLTWKYGKSIAQACEVRNGKINEIVRMLEAGEMAGSVKVASVIRPAGSTNIGRLTNDARLLIKAKDEGYNAALKFFATSDSLTQTRAGALG